MESRGRKGTSPLRCACKGMSGAQSIESETAPGPAKASPCPTGCTAMGVGDAARADTAGCADGEDEEDATADLDDECDMGSSKVHIGAIWSEGMGDVISFATFGVAGCTISGTAPSGCSESFSSGTGRTAQPAGPACDTSLSAVTATKLARRSRAFSRVCRCRSGGMSPPWEPRFSRFSSQPRRLHVRATTCCNVDAHRVNALKGFGLGIIVSS